ncbi:MAG: isoleucine--tRNA ligase [Phycisphaeraceae bacterium]|nr:isoleucine--tRNA ligase [Phycisphaeraceae bacterium]
MSTPPSTPPSAPATDKPAGGAPGKHKYPVNLPKTAFAMKANLVQNEPASLKRWSGLAAGKGLYTSLVEQRAAAAAFVFHDGPPYANGNIHMGHLMNKCLKDFVVRSQMMAGKRCAFVPGWDCHGLPIEHKVMTDLIEGGKYDKIAALPDDQRKMAVRRECRKYAEKFVKLQGEQMQRLLTLGDYAHPYLTMDPAYEGAVLEVLSDLVEQGLVYRALKPVHWSIANETALAEAELEYEDREDLSVYVDFEAVDADAVYDAFGLPKNWSVEVTEVDAESTQEADGLELEIADESGGRPTQRPSFMIWTTTPWTLPANVGIAVNPKHEYALVRIDGNVTVMAAGLVEKVTAAAKAEDVQVLATTTGANLLGLRYKHPFVSNPPPCGLGRVCDPAHLWSVVAADYVTLEDGTGIVHTAPGHGAEDFASGLREHLPIYCPVQGDGTYDGTAPDWLRGVSVWDANKKVTEWLRNSGHLFYDHTFVHSYPHDWRSKTPTIFRCTEQWFVGVDGLPEAARGRAGAAEGRNLRAMALAAVDAGETRNAGVKFVPEWGRNRLRGMLESRPDWCISRQRAWGLPIPAFTTPEGATFLTAASVRAVAKVVREKGSDAWFTLPPEELLKHYDAASDKDPLAKLLAEGSRHGVPAHQLKKGNDILDVWFESGTSWNAVLRERSLGYPADLYLEGSDQHRGWFQSSLLPALGATGQPPFRTLLTHGFMVDKHGKKMSKSIGNDIKVEDLLKDHGADVCRWWVASLAYENDVKVDMEFFALAGESYRKVRNTLRFMLSNLDDFDAGTDLKVRGTSLEAWVLGEFDALSARVQAAYADYDYRTVHLALYEFCSQTLSATYLAAVKDRLYCDKPDSPRRRQTQHALWTMTDGLCRLLAPLLPHTADEAWRALHKAAPGDDRSVHLLTFAPPTGARPDEGWRSALELIIAASKSLEDAKAQTGIQNPLDAGLHLPDKSGTLARFDATDLADLLGVSKVWIDSAAESARVEDLRVRGWEACARSWKRDGTVKKRADGGMLSDRDAAAVGLA